MYAYNRYSQIVAVHSCKTDLRCPLEKPEYLC